MYRADQDKKINESKTFQVCKFIIKFNQIIDYKFLPWHNFQTAPIINPALNTLNVCIISLNNFPTKLQFSLMNFPHILWKYFRVVGGAINFSLEQRKCVAITITRGTTERYLENYVKHLNFGGVLSWAMSVCEIIEMCAHNNRISFSALFRNERRTFVFVFSKIFMFLFRLRRNRGCLIKWFISRLGFSWQSGAGAAFKFTSFQNFSLAHATAVDFPPNKVKK